MKRSGTWLLLFVVLALAGTLWIVLGSNRAPAPDAAIALAGEREGAPGAGTLASEKGSTDPKPHEASARRDVVASAKPQAVSDPDYARHLAGFTGRVVTGAGAAIAGCAVRIHQVDPARLTPVRESMFAEPPADLEIDVGASETDAEGRFEIRGAQPLSHFVLVAGDGQRTPTTFQLLQRTPAPGELVDLGDIVVREAVTVTGRVVDGAGKPVASALVRAADLPGAVLGVVPVERFDPEGHVLLRAERDPEVPVVLRMPAWVKTRFDQLPIPHTRTGPDGKFTLVGVDAGINTLAITCAGFSSFVLPTLKTKLGQDKDLGDLTMSEGESAQGKVVDTAGKPVAGAELLIAQTCVGIPADFAGKPIRADERGHFVQPGFSGGRVTVAARRSARDPWTVQAPAPVAGDLVVKLPATATLTLTLRGAGISTFDDVTVRIHARPHDAEMLMSDLVPALPLEGRTDKPGPATLRIRELPHGSYLVLARAKGGTEALAFVKLQGDQEAVLAFSPERSVLVRVVDPDNRPVRGASVHGRANDSKAPQPRDWTEWRLTSAARLFGATDTEGKLEIRLSEAADTLALSVSHPAYGYGHVDAKLPSPEVLVRLARPGAVEGVLTEKGQPPRPGAWTVEITREWQDGQGWGAVQEVERYARPGANGAFSLAGLRPGKYQASARASLESVRSLGAFHQKVIKGDQMQWIDRQHVSFEVESGRTTTIALDTETQPRVVDGPSAHVTGIATIDGKPAEGMTVFGWTEGQIRGKVDAAGRFDLGAVRAGDVQLQLVDPKAEDPWRNTFWAGQIKVEAGKDRELQIHIMMGSIEGTVVGTDGAPVPQAEVDAWGRAAAKGDKDGESQWGRAQTKTDAQGRFRFERIPAGTYSLQTRLGNDAKASHPKVEVQAGTPITGLELRLVRTFTLQGTIDLGPLGDKKHEWLWGNLAPLDVQEGTFTGGEGFQVDLTTGAFRTAGLVPGKYRLQLFTQERHWHSAQPIVIREENASDVLVKIEADKPPEPVKASTEAQQGEKK